MITIDQFVFLTILFLAYRVSSSRQFLTYVWVRVTNLIIELDVVVILNHKLATKVHKFDLISRLQSCFLLWFRAWRDPLTGLNEVLGFLLLILNRLMFVVIELAGRVDQYMSVRGQLSLFLVAILVYLAI